VDDEVEGGILQGQIELAECSPENGRERSDLILLDHLVRALVALGDDPRLKGKPGRIRAVSEELPALLDDPALLVHLLDDDVAEQAPVTEPVVVPTTGHLLHHPFRDDGKGNHLGMAVREGRAGGRPMVLEDDDGFEALIVHQVDGPLPVCPEHIGHPHLRQVEEIDVVALRLDHHLVSPDAVHLVVDPIPRLPEIPLDPKGRKLVGNHAECPSPVVCRIWVLVDEDLGRSHPLAPRAKRTKPLLPVRLRRGKIVGAAPPLRGDNDPSAHDGVFAQFRHVSSANGCGRNVKGRGRGAPVAAGPKAYDPLSAFLLLGDRLAIDAHRGDRPCDQPLFADLPAAPLANAKRAVIDPFHGLLDLGKEFALPVAEAEGEVPVRFQEGPVGGVREVLLRDHGHVGDRFPGTRQQLVHLAVKLFPAFLQNASFHSSPSRSGHEIIIDYILAPEE
jgi:hypothetical protein